MGKGVDKFTAAKRMIQEALLIGGREYAQPLKDGSPPIVSQHFTAGNQSRYSWAPLSPAYAAAKASGLVSHRGATYHLSSSELSGLHALKGKLAKARRGMGRYKGENEHGERGDAKAFAKAQAHEDRETVKAHLDKVIGNRSGTRRDKGASGGSGGNLPLLVLTGALREAVIAGGAQVTASMSSGGIRIVFVDLPAYAQYHQEGTPRMPKRSPVEPNAADRQQVINAMRRFVERATGKGGRVAVSQSSVPGHARVE